MWVMAIVNNEVGAGEVGVERAVARKTVGMRWRSESAG